MTANKIIYVWGDFGPDSVTGKWDSRDFMSGRAEPFVPLAAIAAAYEHIADVVDTTCDLTDAAGYTAFARSMRELVPGIRDAASLDALAALERVKREAKNEALEAAAKYHDNFLMTQTGIPVEKVVASTEAIRAMKEPEE